MPKNYIITGLDIGSGTIKVLVAQKKQGEADLEVLSLSEETSLGVRKGVIIDVPEVAGIIQNCLEKAEQKIGQKIKSAYVNVGGCHLFSTCSRGLVSVSRADKKISQGDIERVFQAAQTFSLPSNREILDVFPKEFMVDGEREIKEPLGMEGVRLEAEVLVLAGFTPYLRNLSQTILTANLQAEDLILTPLAGSRAVLDKREKELGVAFLDIGAGTTDFCVFEEGNLLHAIILPIGSANITNDIAIGLKSDIDIAERIKLEFGACLFRGADKKKKIEIDKADSFVFSQRLLTKIIEARVSQIFKEVNKELKKISRQGLLPAGIVLTGGGARLPKIVELAKKELKLPCRIGTPQGFYPEQDDPRLSTVCGLVLSGADLIGDDGGFPVISDFGRGIGPWFKKLLRTFIP
ncbi:cell division protein FtsA [Patescibacteria group bacterium]|nr:cell division protein FtsA [Patescibacteria group bacterium]